MKQKVLEFILKWWGPVILAFFCIKLTSICDEKQHRELMHLLIMLFGISIWEMARDFDRIKKIYSDYYNKENQ